jgi:hypothetical protein
MNYQDKLRTFADYLDRHPVLAQKLEGQYEYPSEFVYCIDWEDFQVVIADMGGFTKNGYGGSLEAGHTEKDEDDGYIFRLRATVSGVCTLTPKVDEEGNPVMKKKSRYVETDELEQDTEYSCPDIWTQ